MIVTRNLEFETKGDTDIIDVTHEAERELASSGINNGTLTVFVTHTTCGITIIENEPGLISDFKSMWQRLIPKEMNYAHNQKWGDDNGFAHLRASLLGFSLTVPVTDGKLILGTWQSIVLIDFDNRPRKRIVILKFMGE